MFPALNDPRLVDMLNKLYDCYPDKLYIGGSFATYWALPENIRVNYPVFPDSDIDIFIPANTVTAVDHVLLREYCGLRDLALSRGQYEYKMPHIRKVLSYWHKELGRKINLIYMCPKHYTDYTVLADSMGHDLAKVFYIKHTFNTDKLTKRAYSSFKKIVEYPEWATIHYYRNLLTDGAFAKLEVRATYLGLELRELFW